MAENLEAAGRVVDPRGEDDSSGIRANPWTAHLRTLRRHLEGAMDPRARALAGGMLAVSGARVLARFDRLNESDHGAILDAAIDRLERVPGPCSEARVAHAVLGAAIPVEQRRWVDQIDAPRAEIARDLAVASRRAAALGGRERSIFFAVCALDDTASEEEVGKVVLRAAVAYQMRWNTAHQNVSRAWRKICEGTALGAWCGDWRAGHRFVCGAPPFALWEAGRTYMDACSGRDGHGGEPFDAWVKAHEGHNAWFNEWKKQSSRAARRWRDLAMKLDASGVRPSAVHGALVQDCAALGIDRWVIPAKLAQQSWRELLDAANRPALPARGAWLAFLREHGFPSSVEAAFRAFERDAELADVASVELEHAYKSLLAAAERQSSAGLHARDAFRALIDAGDEA